MKRRTSSIWPLCLLVLGLVVGLAALPPLCHASPPDPTWVAGLYDDADHDDVVLAIVGMVATPTADPPRAIEPVAAGTVPTALPRRTPIRRDLRAQLDRAPPLV